MDISLSSLEEAPLNKNGSEFGAFRLLYCLRFLVPVLTAINEPDLIVLKRLNSVSIELALPLGNPMSFEELNLTLTQSTNESV